MPRKPRAAFLKCDTLIKGLSKSEDVVRDLVHIASIGGSNVRFNHVGLLRCIPALRRLHALGGIRNIKNQVARLVLYYLQGLHQRSDYHNIVLSGPPGCGKTTVAEIIGDIFTELCISGRNGTFKKVRRSDLIGGYLGQTALKTKKVLDASLGGVLFIDEAYALSNGKDDLDQYSKECVDTLTEWLSHNRSESCVIVAGYKEEIEKNFFALNPGLRRRFQWWITFSAYTDSELQDIFIRMVEANGWTCDPDAVTRHISTKTIEFSGGGLEIVFTAAKVAHASYLLCDETNRRRHLTDTELRQALETIAKSTPPVKDPPVHMYT